MSETEAIPPSTPTGPHLEHLPSEVKHRIASYLTRPEALALCLVSRALLDAGESNLYRSLDLLFQRNPPSGPSGISVDPDLYGDGHRATTSFCDKARQLGDVRLKGPGDGASYDLLQGGLRLYSRLFNNRPERRSFVREIYAECTSSDGGPHGHPGNWRRSIPTQVALAPAQSQSRAQRVQTQHDPNISNDIKRTFKSLGILRTVVKLTLKVYYQWEDYLRQFLIIAPNVQRLNIVSGVILAEQVSRIPDLPRLRHLAIENMQPQLIPITARVVERCRTLEGLVIMDWEDRPQSQAPAAESVRLLQKAIEKRRGTRMLFLPIKLYEEIKHEELRNTQVLGIQGPYHPSLRFADLTIPSLPRLRRLFFFLNRSSTFSPFQTALKFPENPNSPIDCAPIHSALLSQVESSPRLVDIHYSNLLNPQSVQGRVQIRTFTRSGAGDTFTHVRVTSNQVYSGGQWMVVNRGSVVQEWTDYRGSCVPLEVLDRIYEAGGLLMEMQTGRNMKMDEVGWKVLDDWCTGH